MVRVFECATSNSRKQQLGCCWLVSQRRKIYDVMECLDYVFAFVVENLRIVVIVCVHPWGAYLLSQNQIKSRVVVTSTGGWAATSTSLSSSLASLDHLYSVQQQQIDLCSPSILEPRPLKFSLLGFNFVGGLFLSPQGKRYPLRYFRFHFPLKHKTTGK